MEDLLSKIYDKVVFYENDSIAFGVKYDSQAEAILEPLKETMTESEIEQIMELIYQASYQAEKDGFLLGVRFMAELFSETKKTV